MEYNYFMLTLEQWKDPELQWLKKIEGFNYRSRPDGQMFICDDCGNMTEDEKDKLINAGIQLMNHQEALTEVEKDEWNIPFGVE